MYIKHLTKYLLQKNVYKFPPPLNEMKSTLKWNLFNKNQV